MPRFLLHVLPRERVVLQVPHPVLLHNATSCVGYMSADFSLALLGFLPTIRDSSINRA
jgi:hypothetical protein